jgi:hypothetical protein
MRFNQDKIDEVMRLLKQARKLLAIGVVVELGPEDESDRPVTAVGLDDENSLLGMGRADRAIRQAIEHLAPVSLEPGLPDRPKPSRSAASRH